MPGTRRDVELFGIITRTDFLELLKKARAGLGSGSELGYVREPDNAIRDAALLAWEYLSGKRVSEFVGRQYYDDIYIGLTMDHWRITKIGDRELLQFYIRILKRYKRQKKCLQCQTINPSGNGFCKKCGTSLLKAEFSNKIKEIWKWKDLATDDTFTTYILEWLNLLKAKNYEGRIFSISRVQAWRIMRNLGITNHINRHWRATHDAATLNIFELQEQMDRATPPAEYVHSEPTKLRKKRDEAERIWEG